MPAPAAAAVVAAFKWRLIVKLVSVLMVVIVFAIAALFALALAVVGMATASAEKEREQEATAVTDGAGRWGGHSNGRIPPDQLCPVPWDNSKKLRCDAAESLAQLNESYYEEFGVDIPVGFSYRVYEAQEHIFDERFDAQPDSGVTGPFNDVQTWNGVRYVRMRGASAAVPGTSNHGWGLAVDLSGRAGTFDTAENDWLMDNMPQQSWIHPEWARKGSSRAEAWHFEFAGFDTEFAAGGEEGSNEGGVIVEVAQSALGTPYVFGGGDQFGTTGGGYDCSGLVQWAVFQATSQRVTLPRTAKTQGNAGQLVTEGLGRDVDMSQLQPGDGIAMKISDRVGGGARDYDHIGIYVGDGTMIHAPKPGKSVEIVSLDINYYQDTFWSVRRYV